MSSSKPYLHEFKAMASMCQVLISGCTREDAMAAAKRAEEEVRRIEQKYSRYRDDSVLSQINQQAGLSAVSCDAETCHLLDKADLLYRHSGGLFDITSGVLRKAWHFDAPALPDPALLQTLLQRIGWQKVERDGDSIFLRDPGMEIDFGGFGKEYATDRAAEMLRANGVHHGYVNLGGDLRVVGPKPDGEPWSIGIRHPRRDNTMVATIPLAHGALTTSGDYERYFELDGQRYCHILNPVTGYPVRHWQSVSVLAGNTLSAGSISTVAMLMEEKGLDFLRSSELSFLAVDQTGTCFHD